MDKGYNPSQVFDQGHTISIHDFDVFNQVLVDYLSSV